MSPRILLPVFLTLFSLSCVAEQVRIYTTTANGTKRMEFSAQKSSRSKLSRHITLQPATTYQEMDGFGYAITYSAAYNLLKMSPGDRRAFLTRTFSRTVGYGVSYVRISIGCSDFSSTEYSLCDTPGLENFRLHSDETQYVIPVLKEILAINPDLKIMAAPWTCPKWMKVKSLSERVGYDSWTSGSLNPNHYQTYADYFVRFVQAFAAEGIPIYAVTPQNEPLNKGNCASLYMPWAEEAAFVNKLAPAFAHAGITTKIYCFDHNYNYDNISSQQDYPIQFYNALDPDMDGRELVVGSAWHDYGGSVTELDDINQKAPDKEVIFTETSIGTWNDGRNLSSRLLTDMKNLVYNTVTRKSKAVMVWNFMLDLNRGPNLDGGCQTCYGAVDIDQNDYHTLTYNSHYYVMAHASLAAQPGAHRIGLSVSNATSDVSCVAFQNPDGSYGAIVFNQSGSSVQMSMGASSAAYARFTVPAKGIVTVVLGGEEEKDVRLGVNVIPPTERSGTYRGTIATQQLESLSQNFIDNPEQWHIAPDFFWWDETDSSPSTVPTRWRWTEWREPCSARLFLPRRDSLSISADRPTAWAVLSSIPAAPPSRRMPLLWRRWSRDSSSAPSLQASNSTTLLSTSDSSSPATCPPLSRARLRPSITSFTTRRLAPPSLALGKAIRGMLTAISTSGRTIATSSPEASGQPLWTFARDSQALLSL